mgnify:CR=1 FL=1
MTWRRCSAQQKRQDKIRENERLVKEYYDEIQDLKSKNEALEKEIDKIDNLKITIDNLTNIILDMQKNEKETKKENETKARNNSAVENKARNNSTVEIPIEQPQIARTQSGRVLRGFYL